MRTALLGVRFPCIEKERHTHAHSEKKNELIQERKKCVRSIFFRNRPCRCREKLPSAGESEESPKEKPNTGPEKISSELFFFLEFLYKYFFPLFATVAARFISGRRIFFSENENQWVRAPVTGRFSLLVAPHVLPHESRPRSAIYLFLARFPRNCSALIPSKMAIHFACAKKTVPHAMYSHWPWIRPKIALSWEKKDV